MPNTKFSKQDYLSKKVPQKYCSSMLRTAGLLKDQKNTHTFKKTTSVNKPCDICAKKRFGYIDNIVT